MPVISAGATDGDVGLDVHAIRRDDRRSQEIGWTTPRSDGPAGISEVPAGSVATTIVEWLPSISARR
jgi:hypothetical protein